MTIACFVEIQSASEYRESCLFVEGSEAIFKYYMTKRSIISFEYETSWSGFETLLKNQTYDSKKHLKPKKPFQYQTLKSPV